jgi:hypothetical protein
LPVSPSSSRPVGMPGPGGDHLGDLVGADFLAHHGLAGLRARGDLRQLCFEGRDLAVEDLAGLRRARRRAALARPGRAGARSAPLSSPSRLRPCFSVAQRASSPRSCSSLSASSARSRSSRSTDAGVVLALEGELLHLHPVHGATQLVDLDG